MGQEQGCSSGIMRYLKQDLQAGAFSMSHKIMLTSQKSKNGCIHLPRVICFLRCVGHNGNVSYQGWMLVMVGTFAEAWHLQGGPPRAYDSPRR